MKIRIIDDFVKDPLTYRKYALSSVFGSVPDGTGKTFRGIAHINQDYDFGVAGICERFPEAMPKTSFFRKSPIGQVEPNDIHSDEEMGDWTGILYLNPRPPQPDGTVFWSNDANWREEGRERVFFKAICRVPARFNRMLLFQADLLHSRAIVDNYGEGDGARLIQVIFGKGEIPWQ